MSIINILFKKLQLKTVYQLKLKFYLDGHLLKLETERFI